MWWWASFVILHFAAPLSADPIPDSRIKAKGAPTLEIVGAISHPSAGTAVGVIYLEIVNHSNRNDRLIAVSTSASARAELHETVIDGNFVRMTPRPAGFEIAKDGQLALKRGGKHIMLIDLVEPLEIGASIELELVFERSDPVRLRVPIRPRQF